MLILHTNCSLFALKSALSSRLLPLVERHAKLAGRVHEQALFIGLQEVHRGGRRDGAVLVLVGPGVAKVEILAK